MFSFGNKAYVQLDGFHERKLQANGAGQAGAAESGAPSSENGPASPPTLPTTAAPGPNMGGDSGRVQIPIGMVSDSRLMRQWQVLALIAFSLVQVILFLLLCILTLCLDGYGRVAVVALGGGLWLALLLFNLRMAGRPRRVIQWFLNSKGKTRLANMRPKKGTVVVVRGAVSLLHEELLSTEFHNVPGLVLVESSLRSYHPGMKKNDAWTEHVRQTRAVDFRITDSLSGATALVQAFAASESGAATPLVHISTEVPLSTAVPTSPPMSTPTSTGRSSASPGPKPIETEERRRRRMAMSSPQLMVCKGYIRQGQVITVMGELCQVPGSTEMCICALSKPYNISKFLLYRGFLPVFFPTWVSGLVVSDQRDLNQ